MNSPLPPGFILDAPDGGIPEGFTSDTPSTSPAIADSTLPEDHPDNTMRYLGQMAKAIYGMSPAGAATRAITETTDLLSGLKSGLMREAPAPSGSFATKTGEVVGKVGPAVAGTAIAGALTGGAGIVPAAAALGLGAAGGEAYGQLGSRALGGNAPDTSAAAAKDIGIAGAEAAASELAVAGGLKLGKAALQGVSQTLVNVSPRALMRVFERYGESPLIRRFLSAGPDAKPEIERQGVLALSKIQDGVERVRSMKGMAVENALNGLEKTTKGQPVAGVDSAIAATEDFLHQPGIDPSKGTAKAVSDLLTDLKSASNQGTSMTGVSGPGSQANLTIKDLISFRRRADKLGQYAKRAMNEADRDVGIAAANTLGSELRASVSDVANKFNNTQLLAANKDFSDFIGTYRKLDDFFGSKSKDVRDMLATLNKASRDFGAGGLAGETLDQAKKDIPFAAKDIETLLDSLSVKAFSADPKYTPSSTTRAVLRQIASPQRTGKTIELFKRLEALKPGFVAAGTAGAQAINK